MHWTRRACIRVMHMKLGLETLAPNTTIGREGKTKVVAPLVAAPTGLKRVQAAQSRQLRRIVAMRRCAANDTNKVIVVLCVDPLDSHLDSAATMNDPLATHERSVLIARNRHASVDSTGRYYRTRASFVFANTFEGGWSGPVLSAIAQRARLSCRHCACCACCA